MNYEEIIEKIEDILEEGKPSFGGGGKIKIDGDAIHECLKELSSSIPTEIIQARKIVAERREILQAAQETASKIVSDAQEKAEKMTQEHDITRAAKDAAVKILNEAQAEANNILDKANADAQARENEAKKWAYEMRTNAGDVAIRIMSDCNETLLKDIEHYTKSQENVQLALTRLNEMMIKLPEDQE